MILFHLLVEVIAFLLRFLDDIWGLRKWSVLNDLFEIVYMFHSM